MKEWIVYLMDKKYTGCFMNETIENDDGETVGFKCISSSNKNILEDQHKGVRFLIEPNYGRELLNFVYENKTRNPFKNLKNTIAELGRWLKN